MRLTNNNFFPTLLFFLQVLIFATNHILPAAAIITEPPLTTTAGGSSGNGGVALPYDDNYDEEDKLIDYESISCLLRTTCEINRQLHHGTKSSTLTDGGDFEQQMDYNHPSQSHAADLPLTFFHQKTSRKKNRRGIERWGPNLPLYLQELRSTLNCPPICLPLAILYLDRACSAQTYRDVLPCPYLTPRTVHRLLLTAMLIASKAVGGESKYQEIQSKFGVSYELMKNMEHWMLKALGEECTWVSEETLRLFLRKWEGMLLLKKVEEEEEEEESEDDTRERMRGDDLDSSSFHPMERQQEEMSMYATNQQRSIPTSRQWNSQQQPRINVRPPNAFFNPPPTTMQSANQYQEESFTQERMDSEESSSEQQIRV